jgi:alpha-ketoglutarate-dependent taurine dioxygenase
MYTRTRNQPFGLVLTNSGPPRSIADIPVGEMVEMLNEYKAILMRGFSALPEADFIAYAKRYGPLLNWEFGEILNLRVEKKPANHIFGSGRVEMHWDGAYLADVPRFGVFQCLESSAGAEGGETLFTDTVKFLEQASDADRKLWEGIRISYSTEKVAHFGGAVTVPLIDVHPYTGKAIVRFIEPYNEDNVEINPIQVTVEDMAKAEQEHFLRDFTRRLYAPEFMYRHRWEKGDFLMSDNNALLHGRSTLRQNISRHLQRIHILDGQENDISRAPIFLGHEKADIHV